MERLFDGGRVQFVTEDLETEEVYNITLSNLNPNAEAEAVHGIGVALGSLIDGEFVQAKVTETYAIDA